MGLRVDLFDLASGKRRLAKELAPADRIGLINVGLPLVTPSGNAYAYFYSTISTWPRV